MGMTPTRLKTPKELHARRMAFELDFEWYPDHDHAYVTTKSFTEHPSQGGADAVPIVRRFEVRRNALFFLSFVVRNEHLPRQARDKRKNFSPKRAFHTGCI